MTVAFGARKTTMRLVLLTILSIAAAGLLIMLRGVTSPPVAPTGLQIDIVDEIAGVNSPSRSPRPAVATATQPRGTKLSDSSTDVTKIMQGEPIKSDGSFKQLHHGIYRVVGATSGVKFALKTECRPPAKWHGQQGWSEVAVYHFVSLLFAEYPEMNTVPPARGVVVAVTQEQLRDVVHKDRCGVIDGHSPIDGAHPPEGHVFLIGVALTWQASHDDAALPSRDIGTYFSKDAVSATLTSQQREYINQIADVQTLDYLLGNEDREDKNWFWDRPAPAQHPGGPSRRLIMMDNGWAFSGALYQESVCGDFNALLTCPPLMRHFTKHARCNGGRTHENCRFRKETVDRIKLLRALWTNRKAGDEYSKSESWRRAVAADPLIRWLLQNYNYNTASGRSNAPHPEGRFSMALARFVHNCASLTSKRSPSEALVDHTHPLLLALADGLAARMDNLLRHVEESCVARRGEAYVFG